MNGSDGRRTQGGARVDASAHREMVTVDGTTISQFSHQLRSLLTSVGAAADYLLTNDPERGVQDEMLGIIAEQTSRIDGLLDDFLVLARSEANQRLGASAVNLYHITRQAVRELAGEAQSAGVWLVLDAAGVVPPVAGDRRPLRQAVMGTLRGLISLARPGERVVAKLEDARDHKGGELVELSVLIQSDDPRLGARAEGLAPTDLSVEAARRICETHGGELQVLEERPGVACRFPVATVPMGSTAAVRADHRHRVSGA